MTTTNNIEIYYCKQTNIPTDNDKLSPSPTINISPELYYANDSVIGYTYKVTLNGYANAKNLTTGVIVQGLEYTIGHIARVRNIFNFNGGNLYVKQGTKNLLVAKGATVKSINFNESSNKWTNYSPYSIELEFNEVDFIGCDENSPIVCNSSLFHAHNQPQNIISNNLVDIKKYKIKEFSDKWSFNISNDIYNASNSFKNHIFKVTYNLSSIGKNYYIDDKLIPAWQQAKNFVQDRLHDQITALMGGVLQLESNNNNGCSTSTHINELYHIDQSKNGGLLSENLNNGYKIYNETIECNTSESDGSFGIVYNAIIKYFDSTLTEQENSALHTYTSEINVSDMEGPQEVTINTSGTVQGLIRGGFIYNKTVFDLPKNGTFISLLSNTEKKYDNALALYNVKIGSSSDLLEDFKNELEINKDSLSITGDITSITPSTYSVDHDYNGGTIRWSAVYTKSQAMMSGKGYTNISITRNDPVDIIQEFIVIGRTNGPIIQKLGAKTRETVSVNIEGRSALSGCVDITQLLSNVSVIAGPSPGIPIEQQGYLLTKHDSNFNAIDGSYTVSLEYIKL